VRGGSVLGRAAGRRRAEAIHHALPFFFGFPAFVPGVSPFPDGFTVSATVAP
jgi:hypothetical protein